MAIFLVNLKTSHYNIIFTFYIIIKKINGIKNKNNGVMSKNNGVKGVFSFSKPNSYQIVTTSIEMVINLKNSIFDLTFEKSRF